jgi:hypothetical protein
MQPLTIFEHHEFFRRFVGPLFVSDNPILNKPVLKGKRDVMLIRLPVLVHWLRSTAPNAKNQCGDRAMMMTMTHHLSPLSPLHSNPIV